MRTTEQIIIEKLERIILMQAQEIKLLKARITDLEQKLERYIKPIRHPKFLRPKPVRIWLIIMPE